jgi:hypothetical protein
MTITFTGNDAAFKQKLFNVLSKNEVGGSAALAYSLSFAAPGRSNSGWSFGWTQIDLSECGEDLVEAFRDILLNAKTRTDANSFVIANGQTDAQRLEAVNALVDKATTKDETIFDPNSSNKSLIDEALDSAYGHGKVDGLVDVQLQSLVARANQVIALSGLSQVDRNFLSTDLGKLFLCDYHNQLNITPGGALEQFVQGGAANLGREPVMKIGDLGVGDLLNFYFRTLNAWRLPSDPIRRFATVVAEAGGIAQYLNTEEALELFRAATYHIQPRLGQLLANTATHTSLNNFVATVLDPAKPLIIDYVRTRYPSLAGLDLSFDSTSILAAPLHDPSLGLDDDSVLNGRRESAGGTELAVDNLLIGGAGDDFLTGGKGDDLLLGGTGDDSYFFRAGDGQDVAIDDDGSGSLYRADGRLVLGFATSPGSNEWRFDQTTYTQAGNDLQITFADGSGDTITIKNFDFAAAQAGGYLGIRLIDTPSVPVNPVPSSSDGVRTFYGDKSDWDGDPLTDGIQPVDDGFGNTVRADGVGDRFDIPYPNREDAFYGSAGSEAERFLTGGGDDFVYADGPDSTNSTAGGKDYLDGGAGNDQLQGDDGNDQLDGKAGNDIWIASACGDNLFIRRYSSYKGTI